MKKKLLFIVIIFIMFFCVSTNYLHAKSNLLNLSVEDDVVKLQTSQEKLANDLQTLNLKVEQLVEEMTLVETDYSIISQRVKDVEKQIYDIELSILNNDYVTTLELEMAIQDAKSKLEKGINEKIEELTAEIELLKSNTTNNLESHQLQIHQIDKGLFTLTEIVNNLSYVTVDQLQSELYSAKSGLEKLINENINNLTAEIELLKSNTTNNLASQQQQIHQIDKGLFTLTEIVNNLSFVTTEDLTIAIDNLDKELRIFIKEQINYVLNELESMRVSSNLEHENLSTKVVELSNSLSVLSSIVKEISYVSEDELQIAIKSANDELYELLNDKIELIEGEISTLKITTSTNYEDLSNKIVSLNQNLNNLSEIVNNFDYARKEDVTNAINGLKLQVVKYIDEEIENINAVLVNINNFNNDTTTELNTIKTKITVIEKTLNELEIIDDGKLNDIKNQLVELVLSTKIELDNKISNLEKQLSEQKTLNESLNSRVEALENGMNEKIQTTTIILSSASASGLLGFSILEVIRFIKRRKL